MAAKTSISWFTTFCRSTVGQVDDLTVFVTAELFSQGEQAGRQEDHQTASSCFVLQGDGDVMSCCWLVDMSCLARVCVCVPVFFLFWECPWQVLARVRGMFLLLSWLSPTCVDMFFVFQQGS